MNAYDNDPRVAPLKHLWAGGTAHRVLRSDGDVFNVYDDERGWWSRQMLGPSEQRGWLRGPFATEYEAIHDLIGDPQ